MDQFRRRVVIVEDDKLMGSLISSALSNEGFDTQCVEDAVGAKKALKAFDPDVIVVDIDLGEGPSGIDLIQMVRRTRPEIAAVLLSKHPDSQSAGFSPADIPEGVAYLRKGLVHDTKSLVASIETTIRGNAENVRHDRHSKGAIDNLTKRQREILHMMALGLTNQEIANRRKVSVSNVEQRVSSIFKALGITEEGVVPRVEAIRIYIAASGLPHRERRA